MRSLLRTIVGQFQKPRILSTSHDVTGVFLELFRAHGLPCTLKSDWITADSGCLSARASVVPCAAGPALCAVELRLEVVTSHGERILEACGGFGKTVPQSVRDALTNLCDGSFHPIYSALTGQPCAHCSVESWQIAGKVRWVFISPVVTRGHRGGEDATARGWIALVEERIKQSTLGQGLHWIRIYHRESRNAKPVTEVLLDNHAWAELECELASYPWPEAESLYSVRLFLMITDAAEGTTV